MASNSNTSPAGTYGWTVRGTDREEYTDVTKVLWEVFLHAESQATMLERERLVFDAVGYERALVALDEDDGAVVGSTNSFAFQMTMPGGVRPTAGVTGVGVWPTHRRRGVLSALMRREIADIHARGEKYAALYASEGGIYGRFGYGPAAQEMRTSIGRLHSALRPGVPRDPALRLRLGEPDDLRADLEQVYEENAADQLGRFRRTEPWWDVVLRNGSRPEHGRGPLRGAVVRGPDGPRGYALYRTRHKWGADGSHSEIHVQEIVATSPAAWVALYEYLVTIDLTVKVTFDNLAADAPLRHLVVDHARMVPEPYTSLWVRLVDVPGALAERSYAAPVEAVLEVTDRYAPWNQGRWRLDAAPEGAACEASDDAPDISLDASHLGAAYLGQTTLSGYLKAGLLTEHTPGAVDRLDRALHRLDAPVCGLTF